MKPDVIVREFKAQDYRDIVDGGYIFDLTELRLRRMCKGLILKVIHALGQEEKNVFVACSPDEEKIFGIVTLRKINDSLWGVWNIFVSPTYRGRGISSVLYEESFKYLRRKGVKKLVGSVGHDNIASIRSIQKTWDGYLSQKYCYSSGVVPCLRKEKQGRIRIRNFRSNDREMLFEAYKESTTEDWYTFLDISEGNVLERFIDHIYSKGLWRLLFTTRILVAEESGVIKGYVIIRRGRFLRFARTATAFLFLSQRVSYDLEESLIREALYDLFIRGVKEVSMYCLTRSVDILDEILSNFGFQVQSFLVPIKGLERST